MRRHVPVTAVVLCWSVVLLLISACGISTPEQPVVLPTQFATFTPEPSATPTPPPTATPRPVPATLANDPEQQAYVRLAHAAPDAPLVDVYIEGLTVASRFGYGQRIPDSGIVAGSYQLEVLPAGARPGETPLAQAALTIRAGSTLTLVLMGSSDTLSVGVFDVDFAPLAVGQTRIQVINALSGAAEIGMRSGDRVLLPALPNGQQSVGVTLASGDARLVFQQGDSVLLEYDANLRERSAVTLVLIGRAGDSASYQMIDYSTRVPGRARVRVINAAPELAALEVYLNSILVAGNIDYGGRSDFREVRADTFSVTVVPAGSRDYVVQSQVRLREDQALTLLIVGSADTARLLTIEETLTPTPPEQTIVTFVHALEGAPRLVLDTPGGILETLNPLAYGQISDPLVLEADTYEFYWKPAADPGESDSVETARGLTFNAGIQYLYVITGRDETVPPLVFSDEVGVSEQVVEAPGGIAVISTQTVPVQVRFVNATTSALFVEFLLNDQPTGGVLTYAQGSPLVTVSEGTQRVGVRLSGETVVLTALDADLLPSRTYTVVVYGDAPSDLTITVWSDEALVIDGGTYLRLFNLSGNADLSMGLAIAPSVVLQPGQINTSIQRPASEQRISLPNDAIVVLSDVAAQSLSNPGVGRQGIVNLYVLDTRSGLAAATIADWRLDPGVVYDVFAVLLPFSTDVRAFVLPYPR